MTRFTVTGTALHGLALLERRPIGDERGWLERLYCRDELAEVMASRAILQINRTRTLKAGTVRGLHFQHPPHAETKLVSCLRGAVLDVAVDLRRGSPTFLRWQAETLSAENCRTLVVPEGFAHGFQTLTDDCELLYMHTAAYCAKAEAGLDALDPRLSIVWPLPVGERSDRDRCHPPLDDSFSGIELGNA